LLNQAQLLLLLQTCITWICSWLQLQRMLIKQHPAAAGRWSTQWQFVGLLPTMNFSNMQSSLCSIAAVYWDGSDVVASSNSSQRRWRAASSGSTEDGQQSGSSSVAIAE
jgi:hypothetical protein